MKGVFKLTEPDGMDASLTITMKIGEWKKLKACITDSYPGWVVTGMIRDLVIKAEQAFNQEEETER